MKKILSICLVVFVVMSSTFVLAEESRNDLGMYVGIVGGMVFPNKISLTDKGPNNIPLQDLTMDNSAVLGAKIGYTPSFLNKILSVEIEYNHIFGPNVGNQYWYTSSGYNFTVQANTSMDTIFMNFKVRYPTGRFHPYVGVAPGWVWMKVSDLTQSVNVGGARFTSTPLSTSANNFAYQILAGVEYDVVNNISLDLGYKFLQGKPSWTEMDGTVSLNFVTLGLNYKF